MVGVCVRACFAVALEKGASRGVYGAGHACICRKGLSDSFERLFRSLVRVQAALAGLSPTVSDRSSFVSYGDLYWLRLSDRINWRVRLVLTR